MIIVRDWEQKSVKHGFEGGKEYIKKVLEKSSKKKSDDEPGLVKKFINEVFPEMNCTLLPRPKIESENDSLYLTGQLC